MTPLAPSVSIELTYQCSHTCLFCSCPWIRHKDLLGKELEKTDWIRVLDFLASRGVKDVTFTGGEPTLKEGFAEILQHAAELPFQSVAVFTNGSTMDEQMLDLFQKNHIQIATSLPGVLLYRKLTGSANSARSLLEKISLAAKRKIHTMVGITVTRQNLFELPLAVLMAVFYHASAVQIQTCMPEGRALEHPDFILSDRQFKKIYHIACLFKRMLKIPVSFAYEQRCSCYDTDGKPTGTVPETCTAGKSFFVIAPDGRMRKCLHSPEATTNIITLLEGKES